jgi:hypothetical protein
MAVRLSALRARAGLVAIEKREISSPARDRTPVFQYIGSHHIIRLFMIHFTKLLLSQIMQR